MRPSTLITTLLPILTTARLTGLRIPSTILPGRPFTAILVNEIYIQTVYDVAVAFGLSPPPSHSDWIGTVLSSQYLGPAQSNLRQNLNITLTIPEGLAAVGSQQVVYAALYSLYGASSMPTLTTFNVTASIGKKTSEEYTGSLGF